MAETKKTPEEIAREAQAQAMKAALEQAQALYGNIPGFESADLMKMHEKLMQDSAEMFPGVAEAQAYQAKMMAESAQDPEAIMETYSKNLEFVGNVMQQAMNAGFMPEGLPDFSDGFDVYAGWEITRKGDRLKAELEKLKDEVSIIGDVRGTGLMLGVEFIDPNGKVDIMGHPEPSGEIAARIQHLCFEDHLVMEKGGRNGSVMRCLCALTVSDEEIDTMLSIFGKAVRKVDGDVTKA